jgi:hypothetical protein
MQLSNILTIMDDLVGLVGVAIIKALKHSESRVKIVSENKGKI